MDKMTKAGYWDQLMADYPDQMNDFCTWIDEYKRREGWAILFNTGRLLNRDLVQSLDTSIAIHDPKFHDLPNAMQIGVFIQYTVEMGDIPFITLETLNFNETYNMTGFIQRIRSWFHQQRFYEQSLIKINDL